MQRFQAIGNICDELELRNTTTGKTVLRFCIAVRRDYVRGDDKKQADFFNCTAWEKTAEIIARYCKKGDKLYVEGKVEMRDYEDNQGIKRRAFDVIVDRTELLGTRTDGGNVDGVSSNAGTQSQAQNRTRPTLYEIDDIDGEVPF